MHWDINHHRHRDLYRTNLLFYLERRARELTQMYGSETGRSSQNKMAVYTVYVWDIYKYYWRNRKLHSHR